MLLSLVGSISAYSANSIIRAYLDPGSGSYLLQLLIAGLIGSAWAIKLNWRKIKALVARIRIKDQGHDGGD